MSLDVMELQGIDFIEHKNETLVLKSLGVEGYVRFNIDLCTKLKVVVVTESLHNLTVCINDVYNGMDYYQPDVKDGCTRFTVVAPSNATVGIHFRQNRP